jgi:hypothetical protein
MDKNDGTKNHSGHFSFSTPALSCGVEMGYKTNCAKNFSHLLLIILGSAFLLSGLATSAKAAQQPQVAAGGNHTVGLRSDGTVVATGDGTADQSSVGGWTDSDDPAHDLARILDI